MRPIEFSGSLVSVTADGRMLMAFFHHAGANREPVAQLRCSREQAFALLTAIQRELLDRET